MTTIASLLCAIGQTLIEIGKIVGNVKTKKKMFPSDPMRFL